MTTEYMVNERPNRAPTHPGELLREDVLPAMGVSKAQFARDIHISRNQLYDILNETAPITANIATRLGKYIGNGPQSWLRMQAEYDLWMAEQENRDILDKIPQHKAVV